MNNTYKTLIASLLLIIFLHPVSGQNGNNDEKLKNARILLNEYIDASFFKDQNTGGYDPSWEGIFMNCFARDVRRIVFDIPFRVKMEDLSKESQTISYYRELVTIDDYIETIRSAFDLYKITGFYFSVIETGFDTTNLHSTNKLQFEIKKAFSNTTWSVGDAGNYIVEMQFIGDQPKITAIRMVDENMSRSNVALTFVNASLSQKDQEYTLAGIVGRIAIEFDESINNRKITARTDTSGRIDLGLAPNRATLKIDTVIDFGGNKYSVPPDWHLTGRKVNTQPIQGFVVPLRQWKWNGFSWSVRGFGGMISQSENGLTNFSPETEFNDKTGYKFGFGLEIVKLYSMSQIINLFGNERTNIDPEKMAARRTTYLGVGMGISYYQLQYKISGEGFAQNPYKYSDRLGTEVEIFVSGSDYNEKVKSYGLVLPIFAELRKTLPDKSQNLRAISLQAGINLMIPFKTEYNISGDFSRHGLYEFNTQPMTNDEYYNYYTQSRLEINDNYRDNKLSSALMFRLSGYFKVFGKKSDNLLDVGLLFSLPFKTKSSEETAGYYLSAGNDDFSSMSNSKNRVYNYFIGLSVGFNFIHYRVY